MNNKNFDKQKEYAEKVANKVKELTVLCNSLGIPMFFAACVKDDGETTYKYELISPALCDVALHDDQISRFVNVMRGFATVPPVANVTLDMDELLAPFDD